MEARLDNYKELKLKLDGLVPPGHGFHRNLLFDALYSSLPRDPQVKVQIYNAEIVPGGYTNWHWAWTPSSRRSTPWRRSRTAS